MSKSIVFFKNLRILSDFVISCFVCRFARHWLPGFRVVPCTLAMMLFITPSYGNGLIPLVWSGTNVATKQFETPAKGCEYQWNHYVGGGIADTPYQRHLQPYVRSWLGTGGAGTWLDEVVPYNTPLLGGWLCFSQYESTNPSTGEKSIQYFSFNWMYPVCPDSYAPGTYLIGSGNTYCPTVPQFFSSAAVQNESENGSCCANGVGNIVKEFVGDPINPATGNTFKSEHDLAISSGVTRLVFNRYYNSTDTATHEQGIGWRGNFSRSITARFNASSYKPFDAASTLNSSLYNDEATACTSGFAQIKSSIPSWTGATVSFSSGNCTISKTGYSLGTLPIYSKYNHLPLPSTSPLGFDVTRDDGMVVRFSVVNGAIAAPPGTDLKLAQTFSGFLLTDGSDSIEQYDSNGRLLSITSRAGLVQTMSYDSSGRLSGVTDNFGHQLTFGYDAQNRLISVTRQ